LSGFYLNGVGVGVETATVAVAIVVVVVLFITKAHQQFLVHCKKSRQIKNSSK